MRLGEHQTVIHDILRRDEQVLRSPERNAEALARSRWALARAIIAYQAFKHHEIFDPVMRRGSPADAAAARRLKAECIASGDAFRTYVAKWSKVSILDHWTEYQAAALALVAAVRCHLARERAATTALLRG
ncbi:hypothetical protein [uncultured Sphingomonas sp.]|uniref:hypothetical protein n=1 Tax=uncultured Sphingomonas sp. TaxID=158754 RepID=UPI0035C944F0